MFYHIGILLARAISSDFLSIIMKHRVYASIEREGAGHLQHTLLVTTIYQAHSNALIYIFHRILQYMSSFGIILGWQLFWAAPICCFRGLFSSLILNLLMLGAFPLLQSCAFENLWHGFHQIEWPGAFASCLTNLGTPGYFLPTPMLLLTSYFVDKCN